MRRLLALTFVLLLLSGLAGAQESAKSASVLKLLLDNERVRVSQATFKPGDKLGLRNYPNHLMYMLTDGTLIFGPAGRTAYEVNFKAGEAMWFPPLARATDNDSDREVRVLLVEFKEGAGSAGGRGKAKAKARARAKAPAKVKTRAKK